VSDARWNDPRDYGEPGLNRTFNPQVKRPEEDRNS
jgi:hypothetical protein